MSTQSGSQAPSCRACFAINLPREVLDRIISATIGQPDNAFRGTRDKNEQSLLASCTLVHTSWLISARQVMYSNIYLATSEQALLLYDTLQTSQRDVSRAREAAALKAEHASSSSRITPLAPLGAIVTALDSSKVWGSQSQACSAQRRLLNMMPNLRYLSTHVHHLPGIQSLPSWPNIRHIELHQSHIHGLRLHDCLQVLPPNLSSLNLIHMSSLFRPGEWSTFTLPSVECLTLTNVTFPGFNEPDFSASRVLPILPRLKTLRILGFSSYREEAETPFFVQAVHKMLNDVAPQLIQFEIAESERYGKAFDAMLLRPLHNLRSFVYNGKSPVIDSKAIRAAFPVSLEHFSLRWIDRTPFGADLLDTLADPTFLPNLKACPTLTQGNPFSSEDEIAMKHLMDATVDASQAMNRRSQLYYSDELCLITSPWDLPLLPFPSAYPRFLERALPKDIFQALVSDTELFPPSRPSPKRNPRG